MNEPHEAGAGTLPADAGRRRGETDPVMKVRASDLEPYTGLRYLSTLFRIMAVLLVLLLIAEIVFSALSTGWPSVPVLLAETGRILVLAGILWGAGDLAVLLVDIGHDVRATRILLGRQAAHQVHELHDHEHRAAADHPVAVERVRIDDRPADLR